MTVSLRQILLSQLKQDSVEPLFDTGQVRTNLGSGSVDGLRADAVESLSAKAYSVDLGPVAMTGQITIELPDPDVVADAE